MRTLVALLAAVLASTQGAHAQAKVDTAVWTELAESADGTAYAVVLLRSVEAPAGGKAERAAAVAERQELVLAALAPEEFRVAYRYASFAALTGRVSAAGLAVLRQHPEVVRVGVDARGRVHLDDSVAFIQADDVHALGNTGAGMTVAVLDTGIDTDHPDLADDVAPGGMYFLDEGASTGTGAEDDHGHGTSVSGVVTSAGVVGSVGVAPDADVLPVKVIDSSGTGFVSDWAAGVDYVVSVADSYDNLCAINMSLGTFFLYSACPCDDEDAFTMLLQTAIQTAKDDGIVTFAASGNGGSCFSMSSPACLSASVAVAAVYDKDEGTAAFDPLCTDATTAPDQITCFSDRSGCNQLAAPGYLIDSPAMGGGTSSETGTSMAAPHVAGVAALMCFISSALTPDVMIAILESTGVPTSDPCATTPNPIRVDALAAVNSMVPSGELTTSGNPPNPPFFLTGVTAAPVLAQVWDPVVDHSVFSPAAIADFMAISVTSTNIPSPIGTILCGLSPLLVVLSPAPGVPFAVPIPLDTVHLGKTLCTQAGSLDAMGGIRLLNGIEITIGAY